MAVADNNVDSDVEFTLLMPCLNETARSVKLILELEQILKHLQAAYYLSRQEPSLDDVWRLVDGYRQKLIVGLSPKEDQTLELARSTGDPNAITVYPRDN